MKKRFRSTFSFGFDIFVDDFDDGTSDVVFLATTFYLQKVFINPILVGLNVVDDRCQLAVRKVFVKLTVDSVVEGVVLQFCTKRQFSHAPEQYRKQRSLIFGIATLLVKIFADIILHKHIYGI